MGRLDKVVHKLYQLQDEYESLARKVGREIRFFDVELEIPQDIAKRTAIDTNYSFKKGSTISFTTRQGALSVSLTPQELTVQRNSTTIRSFKGRNPQRLYLRIAKDITKICNDYEVPF